MSTIVGLKLLQYGPWYQTWYLIQLLLLQNVIIHPSFLKVYNDFFEDSVFGVHY